MYEQLLLFPMRAEHLTQDQFRNYRVRLEHWKGLSAAFLEAFKSVFMRHGAAVLLVHGPQGSGKTLFSQQLEKGFNESQQQVRSGQSILQQPDNLWHTLVADQFSPEIIKQATIDTVLRRVEKESNWLGTERTFAKANNSRVRLFVIDDVTQDPFLREWAGLSHGDYVRFKTEGKLNGVLDSVAQRIVQDCRGDFSRSVFLLLSNNREIMSQLKEHLDEYHRDLAALHELPLPPAEVKEEIVRINTNRLNRISYWACLDRGGPAEKKAVYRELTGQGGFIDSFNALGRTLSSGDTSEHPGRSGRPANKNIITVVT